MNFSIYKHPLLPQRIVKIGFSWPAFLIGPAWLLFKKLWIAAALVLLAATVLHFMNHTGDPFLANQLCFKYGPGWIEPELIGKYNQACEELRIWYDFFILIGINLYVGLEGNGLWASDLLHRGYACIQTVEARSLDDARAILTRESAEFTSTQPHHTAPGRE